MNGPDKSLVIAAISESAESPLDSDFEENDDQQRRKTGPPYC